MIKQVTKQLYHTNVQYIKLNKTIIFKGYVLLLYSKQCNISSARKKMSLRMRVLLMESSPNLLF